MVTMVTYLSLLMNVASHAHPLISCIHLLYALRSDTVQQAEPPAPALAQDGGDDNALWVKGRPECALRRYLLLCNRSSMLPAMAAMVLPSRMMKLGQRMVLNDRDQVSMWMSTTK